MREIENESELDFQAARLTLVALFGSVPPYEALDAQRVRVSPDAAMLSMDGAARLLASMPKPLICAGRNVDGALHVTCDLLVESLASEQERFEMRRKLDLQTGAPFGVLVERYGDGDHAVAAFGHDQSIVVPLPAARQWYRDYEIDFVSWSTDDAFNPDVGSDAHYEYARTRDAKGVLRFSSLAEFVDTTNGEHFQFPLPESATIEERRKLERGLVDLARCRLLAIDDEEELSTVERAMVARGEIPADSVVRRGRDREGYWNEVLASQMKYFFGAGEMPPEVAAFIDACRRSP